MWSHSVTVPKTNSCKRDRGVGTGKPQQASEKKRGLRTHHRSRAAQAKTEDVAKVDSVSDNAAEIQALRCVIRLL